MPAERECTDVKEGGVGGKKENEKERADEEAKKEEEMERRRGFSVIDPIEVFTYTKSRGNVGTRDTGDEARRIVRCNATK